MSLTKGSLLFSVTAASLVAISITAGCQAKPATTTAKAATTTAATAAPQLKPYTAPDQSASVGVPSGWQVTKGQDTVIVMTGPQGEMLSLGNTVVAKNAPFQLGQRGSNGVDMTMPYSTPLQQKLVMILQQNAAIAGKPAPQVTFTSATPIQLPAALGQCGRFVANITGQQSPDKAMGAFCSLPLDSGGTYKNIIILATASEAVAAQSAPTAQAIIQSYRIPATWLQRKLAPNTMPPTPASGNPAAAAAAINRATALSMASSDNSANCFDLSVLRETPTYQLPRSCGGTKPD
jgi:hypothetical protein